MTHMLHNFWWDKRPIAQRWASSSRDSTQSDTELQVVCVMGMVATQSYKLCVVDMVDTSEGMSAPK